MFNSTKPFGDHFDNIHLNVLMQFLVTETASDVFILPMQTNKNFWKSINNSQIFECIHNTHTYTHKHITLYRIWWWQTVNETDEISACDRNKFSGSNDFYGKTVANFSKKKKNAVTVKFIIQNLNICGIQLNFVFSLVGWLAYIYSI